MNRRDGKEVLLGLVVVALIVFAFLLQLHSGNFRKFTVIFLSFPSTVLLLCIGIWCGTFLVLTLNLNDLPLIGLLLIVVAVYFTGNASRPVIGALTLLVGVTVGKGVSFLLQSGKMASGLAEIKQGVNSQKSEVGMFLIGLVWLLAFSSWWHLDVPGNPYNGPRWMGLWNNPNIYAMLMGAGFLLAVGLLAQMWSAECGVRNNTSPQTSPNLTSQVPPNVERAKPDRDRSKCRLRLMLFIAAGMMGVGLAYSYSRGAWVGTAAALLYLTWAYGMLKWRFVLPVAAIVSLIMCCFWGRTPDSAPWYVKRMDFGRPSAQHRVAAWRGALEIMRDHPFGVGWSNAVKVYEMNYSPPENGAAAITTNDYLMLGTQLGVPGLACFVTYVALCFRTKRPATTPLPSSDAQQPVLSPASPIMSRVTCHLSPPPVPCHPSLQLTCRAAALSMLVAFWFDGGLFVLATGSVFWVLLELGREA